MQFSAAVDDFLGYCTAERQLSQHTLHAYAADLTDFRRWLPRGMAPEDVSEASLKGYLSHMVAERKLSVATVRRRLACLRSFYRRFSEQGAAADPFAAWRPRLPRRRRLPRTLSRSEISSLLISLKVSRSSREIGPEEYLPTAVRLMVTTGIRVGELCKLRTEDVSPDGLTFRIHGKGSRDRVAYVTDPALQHELCALVHMRMRTNHAGGSLFVNRQGLPMRPQSVRSKLRRYAADVGFARRVTPHMLRHTAATMLIETGVDIRFVQRLLGHSSIATTEIYTHVSDEALRNTLERADVLAMLVGR
jgi:integrase/recombinase XerD